jgi:hypothetical protein
MTQKFQQLNKFAIKAKQTTLYLQSKTKTLLSYKNNIKFANKSKTKAHYITSIKLLQDNFPISHLNNIL